MIYRRLALMLCFVCVLSSYAKERVPKTLKELSASGEDWPWWRGPARTGLALDTSAIPWRWEDSHTIWKAPVSGRGHACPTVVGDQVFLPTADKVAGTQSILCFDRATGKLKWEKTVFQGGLDTGGHSKTSQASATIACDGSSIYAAFLNSGQVFALSLDLSGKERWRAPISKFVTHQGFAASPAIYKSLVIYSADNKGGGAVAAFDRKTGKAVWKIKRPSKANYTSPIVLNAAGRDQLLITGCDLVTSLDPITGKKLWETPGSTVECVASVVTDGRRVFVSGGYPRNHMQAIEADGSKKTAWDNNTRVYVPSLLVDRGYIYGVTDAGVATCWNSETGKVMWKQRVRGTFSASPILVGNKLLAINEKGTAYVLEVSPDAAKVVEKNELNAEVMSSPIVCGGRIYVRIAEEIDGKRQESLLCLGNP